ncbi:MAG: hypothetical protein V3R83_02400 [Gammaproteobacteria bacterium]
MKETRHQESGDLDTIEAHYRDVLSQHPNRADAHVSLGNVLKEQGVFRAGNDSLPARSLLNRI